MIVLSSADLVVPALLDGVGIGIGHRQGGVLSGAAATSRSAAARTVVDWLLAEGRATGGSIMTDLPDRENKAKIERTEGMIPSDRRRDRLEGAVR
jgi:hypothetical protein